MPNRFIGKYEIVNELGRGAMGVVFRALDPTIERHVAIKVIRTPAFSSSDELADLRMRLLREARAAGKHSHPNIVIIYHVEEQSDFLYLVMEFVEGQSLDQYVAAGNLKQPSDTIRILRQIAEALDYAHNEGVIHRDIKPANVLTGRGGRIKLTDFGIAKIVSQTITQTGVTMGTPAYMSPEQIRADALDGRADQYSLAVVAFEMLTGSRPFEAPTHDALILKIMTERPRAAHDVSTSLPSGCSKVLLKGLFKHREDRYATCIEFVDALAQSLVATPLPRDATVPEMQAVPARPARPETVRGIRGNRGPPPEAA